MTEKRRLDPSILLVDDEPEILNILEIILESEYNYPILKAENGDEAEKMLNANEDIFMVLSDYFMPIKTGGHLYKFNKRNRNLPFVLMSAGHINDYAEFSDFFDMNDLNAFLEKPADDEEILNCISNITCNAPSGGRGDSPTKNLDYKKVRITHLQSLSHNHYDLFIELSNGKFIQISSASNKDMKSILIHYLEKDVSHLFLKTEDFNAFIEEAKGALVREAIVGASSEDEPLNRDLVFNAMGLAFNITQDQLKSLRVSEVHRDLVNRTIESVIGDLQKNKTVFSTLKKFINRKDYLSDHSILNIYFSSYLLDKLNWSNEQTLKQIVFACFYHDMEISDENLAKAYGLSELSEKDHDTVKNHPEKAAKLLDKLEGLNHDAHKIIMDHHERPDGSGFPHGLTSHQIPPLSAVFLLSHTVVDFLLEENFKTHNLANFIQSMEESWCKGNFIRPFNCMRAILLD